MLALFTSTTTELLRSDDLTKALSIKNHSNSGYVCGAYSSTGIICRAQGESIWWYDEDGGTVFNTELDESHVLSVGFSRDSALLFVVADRGVTVWSVLDKTALWSFIDTSEDWRGDHEISFSDALFNPSNDLILMFTYENYVLVNNAITGEHITTYGDFGYRGEFSFDGSLLIVDNHSSVNVRTSTVPFALIASFPASRRGRSHITQDNTILIIARGSLVSINLITLEQHNVQTHCSYDQSIYDPSSNCVFVIRNKSVWKFDPHTELTTSLHSLRRESVELIAVRPHSFILM
jgi:hypothetical protein